MLSLNSLFWSSQDANNLAQKFMKLGFDVSPSHRYGNNQSVFFGPDSIELVSENLEGLTKFEFDSDDIVNDYKALKKTGLPLAKPEVALKNDVPFWFGFNLPNTAQFKGSVIMDSPESVSLMSMNRLPFKHPNTCFGIESVTCVSGQSKEFAENWARLIGKPVAGLAWDEIVKAQGHRVIAGKKFLDCITLPQQQEGVYMITLKVTDLELAKSLCKNAGAKVVPCKTRDGFTVVGAPHLRFVRSFWTEFLPQTKHNFPFYRREDHFRPLGGADTSTLTDGFEDNWKY